MTSLTFNESGLVLKGYQKKLKTMRKKYFVLYKETVSTTARLEYYDSEKKFKCGSPPKRVLKLKNCFNINRRLDTKHNFVISLSSKEGEFGIVLDSEDEMKRWLDMLISLQRRNYLLTESPDSTDHSWQVKIQKRGLAEEKEISGNYCVRLSCKSVQFTKIEDNLTSAEAHKSPIEFYLTTIRRCGDSQCFFYMEVGRQSVIGPGELWMETEHPSIAQNMHRTILSAMSSKSEIHCEPMRKRSSSANEASKPMNVIHRKQTLPEKCNNSPQINANFLRERSDSLPSKKRNIGDYSNPVCISSSIVPKNNLILGSHSILQPRSSCSPPTTFNNGCSESEESSVSYEETEENGSCSTYRYNSRPADGIIFEENNEDFQCPDIEHEEENYNEKEFLIHKKDTYLSMAPMKSSNANIVKKGLFNINDNVAKTINKSDIDVSETEIGSFSQYDFPPRAYSLGSKMEHNRIKPVVNSTYECDSRGTRIRAFSVGSRFKLCRNDNQRDTLVKHSCNSNNNIVLCNDSSNDNTISYANINRDMKSTSAPLLNKSHTSAERMSDLMEIDFSRKCRMMNHISNEKVDLTKSETGKKNIQHFQQNAYKTILKKEAFSKSKHSLKPEQMSEDGYLEMKPVGDLNKSLPQSKPNDLILLASPSATNAKEIFDKTTLKSDNTNTSKNNCTDVNNHENRYNTCIPKTITHIDDQSNVIKTTICSKISNLDINPVSGKRCSELSDSDFTEDDKLSIVQSLNQSSPKSPNSNQDNTETVSNKNTCQTSSQKLLASKSTATSSNSLTTEYNHNLTSKDEYSKSENDQNQGKTTPSSTNSEIKLYYASLDLPQCSRQTNSKTVKDESNNSPTYKLCNEYAKIDFDQSESTSSPKNVI